MSEVLPSTLNGRYRVLRELGRGGMGRVLLVEDSHRNNLQLALKTLQSRHDAQWFLKSFRVEFSELAKLRHPNVATVYDFGTIGGTEDHFFTTEYIDGVDLGKAAAGASLEQLLDITAQLLRGLDFLHTNGLLHNDIKPANVLLESARGEQAAARGDLTRLEAAVFGIAGRVKLIDFGLLSAENLAFDKIRGTPRYLAPERIRCEPADRRCDLYSLGCLLFFLFSGRHPFSATNTKLLLQLHLDSPPPPIQQHRPDLPPAVVKLIHRLLEKRPQDRFESARSALSYLGEALGWEANRFDVRAKTPEVVAGSLLFRETELACLHQAFDEVCKLETDQPCIEIEGPGGAGKTRLVHEFRSTVQVRGGAFIEVGGQAVERHLRPVLDAVMGDLKRRGVPGLEKIEEIIPPAGSGSAHAFHLENVLEKIIFRYAAVFPIVLHFDDFQHAAEAVRRFALELAQAARERLKGGDPRPRLLVVVSCDTGAGKNKLKLPGARPLPVKPFTPEQACEFLRRMFGQDDIPEAVLSKLLTLGGGNPRLLLELARGLVQENLVRYSGTRWAFPSSLASIPLPESLAGAMAKRVAALGTEAMGVLERLSLFRGPASARLIGRSTLLEEARINLLIRRLLKEGLIAAEDGEEGAQYSIALPAVRDAVRDAIPEERRRFLHQRLAQSLEEEAEEKKRNDETARGGETASSLETQETGAADGAFSELLAHHWLEAGNIPGFLRFAPAAADHLQRSGNLKQALEYHRLLLENAPAETAARKIKSLARLSEMHEFLWDLEGSRRDLNEILELGQSLIKPSDRLALLRRLASLEAASHRYGTALELLERARRLPPATEDHLAMASLDAAEAWSRWWNGDHDAALRYKTRAERLLEENFPREGQAAEGRARTATCVAASSQIANLDQVLGRLENAARLHRRNLDALQGLEMKQAEAATRCSLGGVLLDAAKHEPAAKELERSIDLAKEIGDRRTVARARERLGEFHFLHGELKYALSITQMALHDSQALGLLSGVANSLRVLGRIYCRAGQYEDAALVLERALTIYRDTADDAGACLARLAIVKLLLAQDKEALAMKQIEAVGAMAIKGRIPLLAGLHALALLETHQALAGHIDLEAERAATESLTRGGYRREALDVKLCGIRETLEKGEAAPAKAALGELETQLVSVGSNEQRAEADYLRAQLEFYSAGKMASARRLKALEHWAANNVFPHLAGRCRQAIKALAGAGAGGGGPESGRLPRSATPRLPPAGVPRPGGKVPSAPA